MDNLSFLLGLNANNGGGTGSTPSWSDVTDKPFSTIGAGLTITAGGALQEAVPLYADVTYESHCQMEINEQWTKGANDWDLYLDRPNATDGLSFDTNSYSDTGNHNYRLKLTFGASGIDDFWYTGVWRAQTVSGSSWKIDGMSDNAPGNFIGYPFELYYDSTAQSEGYRFHFHAWLSGYLTKYNIKEMLITAIHSDDEYFTTEMLTAADLPNSILQVPVYEYHKLPDEYYDKTKIGGDSLESYYSSIYKVDDEYRARGVSSGDGISVGVSYGTVDGTRFERYAISIDSNYTNGITTTAKNYTDGEIDGLFAHQTQSNSYNGAINWNAAPSNYMGNNTAAAEYLYNYMSTNNMNQTGFIATYTYGGTEYKCVGTVNDVLIDNNGGWTNNNATITSDTGGKNLVKTIRVRHLSNDPEPYAILLSCNTNNMRGVMVKDVLLTDIPLDTNYPYGTITESTKLSYLDDSIMPIDNTSIVPNASGLLETAIPPCPTTTAGTFTLQAVVDGSGNITYSWV